MSRYQRMFRELEQKKEGAFIPFVVLNDPDRATSRAIIDVLIQSGADALELGIAFSDPLADGPTIQKADLRALKNGSNVLNSLELVYDIRKQYFDIPIGLLTYANLVERRGRDAFYKACKQAGVDSVLVADVPLLEIQPFKESALAQGIDPVLIAPLNLPKNRALTVAKEGRGYTYVVTRSGVTGADDNLSLGHSDLLEQLKKYQAPPAIFGFGISTPEHVRIALLEGAAGVISGSQIVSIIEDNLTNTPMMLEKLSLFTQSMKSATRF